MAVYEPRSPELGKNATVPRVNALRAMNQANGPQFKRYERGNGGPPAYRIVTLDGEVRDLATREVPAYVVGQADSYAGVRVQVQEALSEALSDPEVTDRESLLMAVLSGLDDRCGDYLKEAAGHFVQPPEAKPVADAVAVA